MDTPIQDKIDHDKTAKAKVVPQAPQPVPDAATPPDVYTWSSDQPQDRSDASAAPFVLTPDEEDDEPAPDVGGEVGKTPRLLTAWQITGLVVGGLAVVAGVMLYLKRPQDD